MCFDVNEFKKFFRLIDSFVSKEAETFKFRFLMESIYDPEFKEYVENLIKIITISASPELIDKKFRDVREKCIEKIEKSKTENVEKKKMDYILSGLAYFCLLEAFNENSSFSEAVEKQIIDDLGENYLDILAAIDMNNISKDVREKSIISECKVDLPPNIYSFDAVKKYLIMKKWQDEQRSYSLKNIRPLYLIEKEYIHENEENLMRLHSKTLIKRAMEHLRSMHLISIELLGCYQIAGVIDEFKSIIGGKACGLVTLYAKGYKVPETWIIPIGSDLCEETIVSLNKEKKYAVRSSANCEDGDKYSFAGMFESYLNVKYNDLLRNANKVLESVESERVKKYLKAHDITEIPRMAIIVQLYINPNNAGIWMGETINDGVLEWCEGNGQKLVSGEINPNIEKWKGNKKVSINGKKLTSNVGEQALQFQRCIGKTADLEWCSKDEKVYFLQYRAVTASVAIPSEYNKQNDLLIKGIPASGGIVAGDAVFLGRNYNEVDWNTGDILLAWFTDPDWIDIMEKSSGLITAVGGMLCHAAIIARELGIPCVTGIGSENMKSIWNGCKIRMNGHSGTIEIIREN